MKDKQSIKLAIAREKEKHKMLVAKMRTHTKDRFINQLQIVADK